MGRVKGFTLEVVFPALTARARGMILASANIIAHFLLDIYHKVKAGKLEEARAAKRGLL